MKESIEIIGFDADDTLWVNMTYFEEAHKEFCRILEPYGSESEISEKVFTIQMNNLSKYGYGVKGFMLAMIETAAEMSGSSIGTDSIAKILELGKRMLETPVELLDGVEHVLQRLSGRYKLIVATKGDLLDQERKLEDSGLSGYFHHIEIMSDKNENSYSRLLTQLDVAPENFLMIGNSLKSDIIPALNIGCHTIHVPYHITWAHEDVGFEDTDNSRFNKVARLPEILDLL